MGTPSAIVEFSSKALFVAGFLLVCLFGTAPDVPFHMIGLPLCGLGAVLAGVGALWVGRRPRAGALPILLVALTGYFGWRAAVSPVRHLAELDMFLVAALACGFAMTWFAGRVSWLEPWLWLVAVLGTAAGVWQVAVDEQFNVLKWLDLNRPVQEMRASGLFFNQNPFGTWCAMLLLMAGVALFFRRGQVVARAWAAVAMVAAGTGLLLTFCRAAFLGASVGFGMVVLASLVVVARWRAAWWKKLLAGGGVMLVLGAAAWGAAQWLPVLAAKRSQTADMEKVTDIAGRFSYWRTGLSQFLDAPMLGTGSRTFSYLSYKYWDSGFQVIDADPAYVHSEYIQALADYGFAGLLVVLALAGAAYVRAFAQAAEVARRDETREGRAKVAWCLAALGAGTAFLVDVFFSFSGHFAPMVLLVGVLLGGLAAVGRPAMAVDAAKGGRWPWQGWMMLGLTVLAAGFLWVPGLSYGVATTKAYMAYAAYGRGKTNPEQYLETAREQARVLPRYPMFYHVGTFCQSVARRMPPGDGKRRELEEEAKGWFDRALEVYPESVEARLERAVVQQRMGMYKLADEDFQRVVDRAATREFYFRGWMRWGEARYERALEAWNQGDSAGATRWLRESLAAYEQSKKLAWVKRDNQRFHDGKKRVDELIAFFQRTGEWGAE